MQVDDDNNVRLVTTTASVDAINSEFYGRFQFPWAPMTFDGPLDPHFETIMLNQSVGSWDHSILRRNPKIWVAGCGTNQAAFTALRFPEATILGTDLSAPSLATCESLAKQLGIKNLELKQETINYANYEEEFDYIICTGVIHHNANPEEPLEHLARALRRTGILELMVYNRYHRILTTAFQKAVRILEASLTNQNFDFETEIGLARKLLQRVRTPNAVSEAFGHFKDCPESELADALLQPVEYSFTVESLEAQVNKCGLDIMAHCINQFDKAHGNLFWNMEFDDPSLQTLYDALPDSQRWQVSNHLMLQKSPMLWFYLQRSDSGRQPKAERQLCEEFLDRRFVKSETRKKVFIKSAAGEYVLSSRQPSYPGLHVDAQCTKILKGVGLWPTASMREIFEKSDIDTSFSTTNKLRLLLTTNAFPFLIAVEPGS